MEISGAAKVCGIIGDPIEHTLSPVMHNAAFGELRLDFVYVPFRVRRGELRNALIGSRALGIAGLNVTMPHKNAAMRYLDEVDLTAKRIGAVNTIHNVGQRLRGYNTDGVGATKALRKNGVKLDGKKLVLLGAGGTARSIAFHVAQDVEELLILNRTLLKAKQLANILRKEFGSKIEANSLSSKIIKDELPDADILINATSVGMRPDTNQSLVPPSLLRPDLCLMDTVYDPLETKLSRDAKSVGARVVSGIDMLVYQGAASFKIWTDHRAPIEVMKRAVLNKIRSCNRIERAS
jgi:shikimate dehydrogenase